MSLSRLNAEDRIILSKNQHVKKRFHSSTVRKTKRREMSFFNDQFRHYLCFYVCDSRYTVEPISMNSDSYCISDSNEKKGFFNHQLTLKA